MLFLLDFFVDLQCLKMDRCTTSGFLDSFFSFWNVNYLLRSKILFTLLFTLLDIVNKCSFLPEIIPYSPDCLVLFLYVYILIKVQFPLNPASTTINDLIGAGFAYFFNVFKCLNCLLCVLIVNIIWTHMYTCKRTNDK